MTEYTKYLDKNNKVYEQAEKYAESIKPAVGNKK